jgi:DNA-binding NarL/FixJ family response regulator
MASILRRRWPEVECGFAVGYGSAIDLLGKRQWGLALIELNLSGRGGLDLVSKVVSEWKIPALLVSGEPEETYGRRALRCGSAGYLRRDLAAVLDGGCYVSEELAQHLASRLHPQEKDVPDPFESLSDREFQVLRAVADGQCVKEIAAALSLSSKTVSTYRARVLIKLHLKTDADLVKYCIEHRLVG